MFTHAPLALSHLKFRHLVLVEQLFLEGTIHKAAKKLSISQPAATAMLNDLENLLGVTLFARTRQGVEPTAHAHALRWRVRTILNEFDELAAAAARIAGGETTVLRIGVVPQAYLSYLPSAIVHFRNAGGCAVRTREGTARQLMDLLMGGELDCVVGRFPSGGQSQAYQESDLEFTNLYVEGICIVSGPRNPILGSADLCLELLAQQEWALQRPDSAVRLALTEAFLRRGIHLPKPVVETDNYLQNLMIVAKSNLLSVAPLSAARMHQKLGLIRTLDTPLDVVPMQVSLIRRKTSHADPFLSLFHAAFIRSVDGAASNGSE